MSKPEMLCVMLAMGTLGAFVAALFTRYGRLVSVYVGIGELLGVATLALFVVVCIIRLFPLPDAPPDPAHSYSYQRPGDGG